MTQQPEDIEESQAWEARKAKDWLAEEDQVAQEFEDPEETGAWEDRK